MALYRAFQAFRPEKSKQALIPALPYDVMNSDEVYRKAKENLENLEKTGALIQDKKPCFYIYRQIMNGRSQTGIVGCASIDDYMNNVIKKHEHTLAKKEEDRIRHVDTCNANTGPIFLTYRKNDIISNTVNSWANAHESVYDFVADGVNQTVWVIDDEDIINTISTEFAKIDALYIFLMTRLKLWITTE